MRIIMIGCGEVGACYAQALAAAGYTIAGLIEVQPSPAVMALAKQLGAPVHRQPDAHLAQADLVISAVYGSAAHDTAAQAMPLLRAGALYADFTTASPQAMVAIAEIARTHKLCFVDVAITGAIRMTGAQTPLLCAGPDCAALLTVLSAAGIPVRRISARPGDAASLKLMRSIITKGMEALAVECLVAAQRQGLREALFEVLNDIDRAPLRVFLETCVQTHVQHAPRRLAEVQEAKRQLRQAHLQPLVMDGVEALFARSAAALKQGPAAHAASVEDSLAWLARVASQSSSHADAVSPNT